MATIELLAIANHAETHDGLLHLVGACWTVVDRAYGFGQEPPPMHFGVGVAVAVPGDEAGVVHVLRMRVEPVDGGPPLLEAQAQLEVGVPEGLPPDVDQRAVLAASGQMAFPGPGAYRLVAEVAGDRRAVSFYVRDQLSPSAQPYPPPAS